MTPIITLIIGNQSCSKVGKAFNELITKLWSPKQEEKRASTPTVSRTSGVTNSREIHSDIDPLLARELGTISYDIPHFRSVLMALPKDYEEKIEAYWESCKGGKQEWVGNGWDSWPKKNPSEDKVGPFLKKMCEKVLSVLEGEQKLYRYVLRERLIHQ